MRDSKEMIVLPGTATATEELTITVTDDTIQMKGAASIGRLEELKQSIDNVIAALKEHLHEECECTCERCQEDN